MKKQTKMEYEQPNFNFFVVELEEEALVGSNPFETEDLEEEDVNWDNN